MISNCVSVVRKFYTYVSLQKKKSKYVLTNLLFFELGITNLYFVDLDLEFQTYRLDVDPWYQV